MKLKGKHVLKKIIFSIFCMLLITQASYAEHSPQYVKVCVDIQKNATPYTFSAAFYSKNFASPAHWSYNIAMGKNCVDYTYSFPRKKIQILLQGRLIKQNHNFIYVDASCGFMGHSDEITVADTMYTPFFEAGEHSESWTFTIKQKDGIAPIFNVSCQRQSN